MTRPIITLEEVEVRYGSRRALALERLDVPQEGVHIVVGGNGAGKSTLLATIAGIADGVSGRIRVLGADPYRLRRRDALKHRRRLTLCPQQPWLFDTTVGDNVAYGLRRHGYSRRTIERRAMEALDALGLSGFERRPARALSGGEAQRVALARVLALAPELVLLDEPLVGVDAPHVAAAERAILGLAEAGSTVVVATHDVERAYTMSARVLRLDAGRLAPPLIDNLITGEILRDGDGASLLMTKDRGLSLAVVAEPCSRVSAAVDPSAILVSRAPFTSSARNVLPGRVTGLVERGDIISVTVDVGAPLVAHVTPTSLRDLEITIGSSVYLAFKATAVHVFQKPST